MIKISSLFIVGALLATPVAQAAETANDRNLRCLKEADALHGGSTRRLSYLSDCTAGRTPPVDPRITARVLAPGEVPKASDPAGVKDTYCRAQAKGTGLKGRNLGTFLDDCMKKLG